MQLVFILGTHALLSAALLYARGNLS